MTVPKFLLPMQLQFFAEPPAEETPVVEPAETSAEPEPEPQEPVIEPTVETPVELSTPDEQVSLTEELEALKQQVAELQSTKESLESKVAEKDSEVSATATKVTDYEAALTKIVDERLTAIPETISALMPDGLSVAEKLAWVEKAEKAVPAKEELAQPAEPAQPVIETIGKATPVETPVEVDMKDLTADQKLSNFFQEFFGK